MILTKEIFDQLKPREIFRVVTTRVQAMRNPMEATLIFACIKDRSGIFWAIYAAHYGADPETAALYGDKVGREDNIRSICPCDDEMFALYRY